MSVQVDIHRAANVNIINGAAGAITTTATAHVCLATAEEATGGRLVASLGTSRYDRVLYNAVRACALYVLCIRYAWR